VILLNRTGPGSIKRRVQERCMGDITVSVALDAAKGMQHVW